MGKIVLLLSIVIPVSLLSQTPGPDDSSKNENIVLEKVEVESNFPGGNTMWRKYLERNLYILAPIDNGAPAGTYTVVVQFLVDTNGFISDVKPLTSFGYGMEEEVVRVIKKGPSWEPAIFKGKPVKAYRKQPVTFVVPEEGFDIITSKKYIFYTDTENEMLVNVDKVNSKDVEVRLSEGTITRGVGEAYMVKVTKPGHTILYIFNKKKNKLIGSVYFIVKKKIID